MTASNDSMRCKHCRYRLDGLTDNRCPECGRSFHPSHPSTYSSDGKIDWSINRPIATLIGILMVAGALTALLLFTVPDALASVSIQCCLIPLLTVVLVIFAIINTFQHGRT